MRSRRPVVVVCLGALLGSCVVDDPVGARATDPGTTGVEPVEGARYDERTDTYSVERSFDLDGTSETKELVETMRGR